MAPDLAYQAGLGFYRLDWFDHLHQSFVLFIERLGVAQLPLVSALQQWQAREPELVTCETGSLETLLDLWPEFTIQRASIFEAQLIVTNNPAQPAETEPATVAVTRKIVRERRATYKKAVPPATIQTNLWE
jgi:hypothetical protein